MLLDEVVCAPLRLALHVQNVASKHVIVLSAVGCLVLRDENPNRVVSRRLEDAVVDARSGDREARTQVVARVDVTFLK